MVDKYKKIEHSEHHLKRMAEDEGHRYTVEDATFLIANPEQSGVQQDGRDWFFGWLKGNTVLMAVSAVVMTSASDSIEFLGRIKTMHRRKKPRKNP